MWKEKNSEVIMRYKISEAKQLKSITIVM